VLGAARACADTRGNAPKPLTTRWEGTWGCVSGNPGVTRVAHRRWVQHTRKHVRGGQLELRREWDRYAGLERCACLVKGRQKAFFLCDGLAAYEKRCTRPGTTPGTSPTSV
jgi:hypothetical protein